MKTAINSHNSEIWKYTSPEEFKNSNIKYIPNIITIIRNESNKQDKHIGILVDLAGPKIRLNLKQIGKTIDIKKDDIYNC